MTVFDLYQTALVRLNLFATRQISAVNVVLQKAVIDAWHIVVPNLSVSLPYHSSIGQQFCFVAIVKTENNSTYQIGHKCGKHGIIFVLKPETQRSVNPFEMFIQPIRLRF
jgi:hypothetical protein